MTSTECWNVYASAAAQVGQRERRLTGLFELEQDPLDDRSERVQRPLAVRLTRDDRLLGRLVGDGDGARRLAAHLVAESVLDDDALAELVVDVDGVDPRLFEPAPEALVQLHALAQQRNPVAAADEHVTREDGVFWDPCDRDQAHIP